MPPGFNASENAKEAVIFRCVFHTGPANLSWLINDIPLSHLMLEDDGIFSNETGGTEYGVQYTTVSIPPTAENNGISLQCHALLPDFTEAISSKVVFRVQGM